MMEFIYVCDNEWVTLDIQYRIQFRDSAYGIAVTPGFTSCVRCGTTDKSYWSFCGARRPYRTFEAAQKAAERHRRTWTRYEKLLARAGKGRAAKLTEFRRRAFAGQGTTRHNLLTDIPLWAEFTPKPKTTAGRFGKGLSC